LIDDDVTAPGDLGGERLQLADGVELLGRYQGSGFKEAPYLVKRADGQVIQVTELIYLVVTCLAAGYHLHQVARRVTEDLGRTVSVENVAYLVHHKLRPAGLLRPAGGPAPGGPAHGATEALGAPPGAPDPAAGPSPRAQALLALRLRVPLVPARVHGTVTGLLQPLFRLPVVVAGLAGLVVMDAWLLLGQRDELVDEVRALIYRPQLVLVLTALTLLAGVFHETGHATAARYGGATPGAMGAGVYLVWPVFYTDVTDAYRLSRRGRLRTDLGGVWFNVLFALGAAGVYLATGFGPLLVYLVVAQLETLRQFLPFVRLDGYYVVSDLAGVPNLFAFMRPVLVSLLYRRQPATRQAARAKLDELTPRARRLITAWVLLTVPVLLVNLVLLVVALPRLAGAAWGSAGAQLRALTGAGGFDLVSAANGLVGLLVLAVPVLGMTYIAGRMVERVGKALAAGWQTRPVSVGALTAGAGVLVAWQVGFVWPEAFADSFEHAQAATSLEAAAPSGHDGIDGLGGLDVEDLDPTVGAGAGDEGDGEGGEGEQALPATGTVPPGADPGTTTGEGDQSGAGIPDVVAQSAAATSLPPPGTSPAPASTGEPVEHPGSRSDVGEPRPTSPPAPPSSTTPTAPPTTEDPELVGDLLEAIFGPPPR
jgi:putative peptide zinc metalloprotease protein